MIDQHQVLFVVFSMISFLWSIIGAAAFLGKVGKLRYLSKKRQVLAFLISGPFVWITGILVLIKDIFDIVWDSKHLD